MKRLKLSPAGGTVVCEEGSVREKGSRATPSPPKPQMPPPSGFHLDFVEQVLVADVAVVLQELDDDFTHVDLLLHDGEDGSVLLAGLHQDVIREGCGGEMAAGG